MLSFCTHLPAPLYPPHPFSFTALLDALEDYTTSFQGDVGSWVREAAMVTCTSLVVLFFSQRHGDLDVGLPSRATLVSIIGRCLRNLCGRIDRTRVVAARSLILLLNFVFSVPTTLSTSSTGAAPSHGLKSQLEDADALMDVFRYKCAAFSLSTDCRFHFCVCEFYSVSAEDTQPLTTGLSNPSHSHM